MGFVPTLPPVGRLVHLGAVVDAAGDMAPVLVRMLDRVGVNAVWLQGPTAPAMVGELSTELRSAELGVVLAATDVLPVLGHVTLPDTADAQAVRAWRARLDDGSPNPRRLAVTATDAAGVQLAAELADDVVLRRTPLEELAGAAAAIRGACRAAARDPDTLGVALHTPVSVGRTAAEADARRALAPELFWTADGAPTGIVGRLEDCQEQVLVAAHAGITDLRAELPPAPDVHDMLGQLRATVVGSRDRLVPGAPRSPDPDPPPGWGGPPRRVV